MRRITQQMLFCLLLVTLVACAMVRAAAPESDSARMPSSAAEAAPDPANGEGLFNQSCVACHGQGGAGIEGLGKEMTSSVFVRRLSDEALAAFIKTGRPADDPANTTGIDMPPQGGNPALTDAQLLDIIAYLRTLQK